MSPSVPPRTAHTHRHTQLALLDALARAPFVRAEDLALELGVSLSQSVAHLRSLEAERAIAHVSRPAGPAKSKPAYLYFLRPAGLAALCQEREQTAPWWGTQDRRFVALLPRLDRLLVGHAFLRSLLTAAPRMLSTQGRAAHVGWTWIRDYQQVVPALPQRPFAQAARLFADFLLVLRVRQEGETAEQLYPLFVLVDHACLPQKQVRARLQALLHARAFASGGDPQAKARFPLVMILLPTWYRARHWQRLAVELNHDVEHPLRGCLAVAPPTNLDGWRLPWQTLFRYGPCENPRALLVPTPSEACPPAWLGPSHHGLEVREGRPAGHGSGDSPRRQEKGGNTLTNHLAHQLQSLQANRTLASRPPHLLGVALERAHYRILELLCVAPLLTRDEIAVFLGLQEASVRQYCAEMRSSGCLEAEHLPGEFAWRFRLSSQGLQLLARRHHLQLRKLAFREEESAGRAAGYRQQGLDKLRRTATLTRGVYAFLARLTREARARGHQLLWWETGYAREQAYYSRARAAWRWEKSHGIGEYQAGTRRVRFWLEWHGDWEAGANRLHALATLFAGYATYIQAREWSREGHVLPILLLVCPDGARERQIQHLARTQLGSLRPKPIVLSTTREDLDTQGPLSPVWLPVLLPHGEPGSTRQAFYELCAEEESNA